MKVGIKMMVAACMACGALMLGSVYHASAGEIMIIANPSVPAESLDPDAIRNLFLGKTAKWENNDMVTIVVSEQSDVHKGFLEKYIKRTENQFSNVWRQNLFTGKGKQPVKVNSVEELVDYVSKTPGAIGYISSDAKLPPEVKVLAK
ncbi:MAG: substrate-binding domain-containing protein [Proteobacteria bacterium]|nr:substrate-binding domain-containing protein [Pseudomonadota bacterium]